MDAKDIIEAIPYVAACTAPFAVICALAAKPRNRNQGDWFFIGLVTGALGLIALLSMGKAEAEATRQSGR